MHGLNCHPPNKTSGDESARGLTTPRALATPDPASYRVLVQSTRATATGHRAGRRGDELILMATPLAEARAGERTKPPCRGQRPMGMGRPTRTRRKPPRRGRRAHAGGVARRARRWACRAVWLHVGPARRRASNEPRGRRPRASPNPTARARHVGRRSAAAARICLSLPFSSLPP